MSGYNYKENAQEIFENFFGTGNPFSTFGFGETAPFSTRLNKPGPKKGEPVLYNLECTLEELYSGCTKKFNVVRKRWAADGTLCDDTKQLVIAVKPGWKKGTKVTFPSEGDDVACGNPSDIIFVIQEKFDNSGSVRDSNNVSQYVREGNDLIYTYKISLADALSDCSLQIPTLDNRVLSIACPEVVSPFYEKLVVGR